MATSIQSSSLQASTIILNHLKVSPSSQKAGTAPCKGFAAGQVDTHNYNFSAHRLSIFVGFSFLFAAF